MRINAMEDARDTDGEEKPRIEAAGLIGDVMDGTRARGCSRGSGA